MLKPKVFLYTIFCCSLFLTILLSNGCTSEHIVNTNQKQEIEIITSDIENFWTAFHATKTPRDTIHFYQYFENASDGLKYFANDRRLISPPEVGKGNVQEMVGAAFRYKKFYESIEKNTKDIVLIADSINYYCLKLQELYKVAKFPKVYFIMGRFGAAGIPSDSGLVLSAEMLSIDEQTKLEELESVFPQFLKSKDAIPVITVHELIHFLQPYKDSVKTILDNAIIEGGADFIADLVVGRMANEDQHKYGREHEKELWDKFKHDLDSTNLGLWFYDYFEIKNHPPDLGYFMGYKICESYYKNSADKKKAVKEIIEVKDFKSFFLLSKYKDKFVE